MLRLQFDDGKLCSQANCFVLVFHRHGRHAQSSGLFADERVVQVLRRARVLHMFRHRDLSIQLPHIIHLREAL